MMVRIFGRPLNKVRCAISIISERSSLRSNSYLRNCTDGCSISSPRTSKISVLYTQYCPIRYVDGFAYGALIYIVDICRHRYQTFLRVWTVSCAKAAPRHSPRRIA